MNSVRAEWNVVNWPPGVVNNERETYIDDGKTLQTANNILKVVAYSEVRTPKMLENHDIRGNNLYAVSKQPISSCSDHCRNDYRCVAYSWT